MGLRPRNLIVDFMETKKITITVIVAAYNEEPIIANNLQRIEQELMTRPDVHWQLICVNDGSHDNTGQKLENFAAGNPRVQVIHHRRNFGQGRALRSAFDQSLGEFIVTLDADLSYGPEYIYVLIDALQKEKVEIALASPYAKGGSVWNVPFHRRFLSRLGNFYLARMSHLSISTSTCAVRAYRREVIDSLGLNSDGMELQLEVLMKASLLGFRVCEVPAELRWLDKKQVKKDSRRASKMRIMKTIQLYLLMGWLSRPASIFMILSILMLCAGVFLAINAIILFFGLLHSYIDKGFVLAVSNSLKGLVLEYYYGLFFSCSFLLFGFLTFAFSLVLIQNKFYFEELYRLGLNSRKTTCFTSEPTTPGEIEQQNKG